MTVIDKLDKIHPDLIATYLSSGQCEGIPEEVQLFLKQIQWAAEIYEYERNMPLTHLCGHQLFSY